MMLSVSEALQTVMLISTLNLGRKTFTYLFSPFTMLFCYIHLKLVHRFLKK